MSDIINASADIDSVCSVLAFLFLFCYISFKKKKNIKKDKFLEW